MNGADLGMPPLGSRYRLLKALGQGGFGQTYLAEDLHRFDELCVLKEFVPQVSDPALLVKANELFEREAGVLYRLQHPQIPRFRELLRVDGDRPRLFLVQDYVEGPTYRTLLTNRLGHGGRFTELEVTQLLHQLLPVLDYIHSVGVIHRDISPENLILRNTDGLPVLIDFGSVKQIEANVRQQLQAGSPNPEPQDRTRIGKVGYAPPEQAQTGAADPTSDLYGLGATALTLVTGQEPDTFYNAHEQRWDWSNAVTLSSGLQPVLLRLLAPNPAERFPSAAAVMTALQAGQLMPKADPAETFESGLTNGAIAPPPGPIYPDDDDPAAMTDLAAERMEGEPEAGAAAVAEAKAIGTEMGTETTAATIAAVPVPPDPTEVSPVMPSSTAVAVTPYAENPIPGVWQALVGLLVLLGLAGLVGLLLVGRPGLLRLPNLGDRGTTEPSATTDPVPTAGPYSAEEVARKQALQDRRQNLGVPESYLNQLVNQIFYQRYPDLRDRALTDQPEDAPLRVRWDNLASDLLDTLEAQLSTQARRGLGSYGPSDRDGWQTQVNGLNVSSRALYDLADAKFTQLFPSQTGESALAQPVGQIWYALADDRVRALASGERLRTIQFEPNAFSQQVSGELSPGQGQVLLLNLSADQILRLTLQAPADSTLLSLYVPSPTESLPFLLSDATETRWSGRLPQSGYYEVVVVSKSAQPLAYQLTTIVDQVTIPAPPEETTEETPDEGAADPATDTDDSGDSGGETETGESGNDEATGTDESEASSGSSGVQF